MRCTATCVSRWISARADPTRKTTARLAGRAVVTTQNQDEEALKWAAPPAYDPNGSDTSTGHANPIGRYVAHAERFGVELVFETAAGLGEPTSKLPVVELVNLARRLKAIDTKFNAAKPDKLVKDAGVEVQSAYLARIAPALDALGAPAPTLAGRCCEWCGAAIAGHRQRRTCSPRCRKALARAGGIGPFSAPDVTVSTRSDQSIVPRPNVTLLPHDEAVFGRKSRGLRAFAKFPSTAPSSPCMFGGGAVGKHRGGPR